MGLPVRYVINSFVLTSVTKCGEEIYIHILIPNNNCYCSIFLNILNVLYFIYSIFAQNILPKDDFVSFLSIFTCYDNFFYTDVIIYKYDCFLIVFLIREINKLCKM